MAQRKTDDALKAANSALARGDTSRDNALQLIDDSQDVLSKALDKKVCNSESFALIVSH